MTGEQLNDYSDNRKKKSTLLLIIMFKLTSQKFPIPVYCVAKCYCKDVVKNLDKKNENCTAWPSHFENSFSYALDRVFFFISC